MSSTRQILQVFEQYQKSRVQFVQTVAELSSRPQNIEVLQNAGVMLLLRPLLLDIVPSIQQTAVLALGRLANRSCSLAEAVVKGEILPQLAYSLTGQNRFYKKAAAFVLRSVAKHNAELAQAIVDCNALPPLVACLDEFDASIKEAVIWALGNIARHTPFLAQSVVDAGAVPLLVMCIQEPELSVKRVAVSTLSEIGKHTRELAQTLVDASAVPFLAQLVLNPDVSLKRQVYSALAQIAKHSVEFAEMVVEAELFPAIFVSLKDNDELVKKNTATLIREIVKHTPELAQLMVNSGGIGALVDYIGDTKGATTLPAIMALGFTAAHSEHLAMSVIKFRGIVQLCLVLTEQEEDYVRASAAWALGQIGRHTPEHAKAVAQANVFPKLLEVFLSPTSSNDLQLKCKKALKNILQKCVYLPALNPLLQDAPANIIKHVLSQYSKVLPNDPKSRKMFVTSGGLRKVQELKAEPGTMLMEYINTINSCYPEEIVKYYSPGYPEQLLERVEKFKPVHASV